MIVHFNSVNSQNLSIGFMGGIKSFPGNSYYSKDIGWPGIYEINGTRTWFTGLGFSSELNLGLVLNYRFSELPLGLTLDFNYSSMNGKSNWPQWDLNNPELPPTYSDIEARMDYYSLGLGGKYFFPIERFEPYISVSALMNYFGDVKSYYKKMDSEYFVNNYGLRYGLSFGGGMDYKLSKSISVNGNIAFEMNNFIKSREGEDKFNTLMYSFGIAYYLL